MRNVAGTWVLFLWAAAALGGEGASSEVDAAVARLRTETQLSAREQELWREAYDDWLDSEQGDARRGNPEVGKALEELSLGRLPDEDGMEAIMRMYNKSKSGEYARAQEEGEPSGRKPAAPQPPLHEWRNATPYMGLALGFAVAVLGLGVAAKLLRRGG